MTNETGTWVDPYLETGGRLIGIDSIGAGLAAIEWGWHVRDLMWFAIGVVLLLLGLAFLAYPIGAWEVVAWLPFLLD